MTTYKIVRFYFDRDLPVETVHVGMTLEQAQAHCRDPETSSRTATSVSAQWLTERRGSWFEGYEAE